MVRKNGAPASSIILVAALTLLAVLVVLLWAVPGGGIGSPARAAAGDGQWVWQNPLPQGNNLHAIRFVDSQTGWAAGAFGTILKTTDGGSIWTAQSSGMVRDLNALSFVDANTGWAVGEGIILKTENGGATWIIQRQDACLYCGNSLNGVVAFDTSTAWVFGYGAFILKTGDGGATWVTVDTGIRNAVTNFSVLDRGRAFTSGFDNRLGTGVLYRTTDGGETWTASGLGPPVYPSVVFFLDALTGWVLARPTNAETALVLRTTDGGTTWASSEVPSIPRLATSVFFSDAQHGWVLGNSVILRTMDGGVTWSSQPMEGFHLYSVFFRDSQVGWVAGQSGQVFKTVDGGQNWLRQSSGRTTGLSSVVFVNPMTGWVAGGNGAIFKTSDGGVSWTAQYVPVTSSVYSLFFLDAQAGWALTYLDSDNGVLKTVDGGANWTVHPTGGKFLTELFFVDSNTGWAVGLGGAILKTTDGGATWTDHSVTSNIRLYSVHFVSSETGWAVGHDKFPTSTPFARSSIIFKTTDGGLSWTSIKPGSGYGLLSVTFVDAQTGWAVGEDMNLGNGLKIWKTADGGAAWTSQAVPAPVGFYLPLNSVSFVDAQTGWIVGSGGFIFSTSDGGANWVSEPSGTSLSLQDVSFTDPLHGWAVGGNSAILRRVQNALPTPTPTPAIPNLTVGKIVTKDRAFPGDPLTYIITLDNSGQADITVSLTDTIPSGTSLITGTLTGSAVYSPTINSVLWSGTVPPGGSTLPSAFFSFRTLIDNSFSSGAVTNTVQVSSGAVTTGASARTDVRRWMFLPVLLRGSSGW